MRIFVSLIFSLSATFSQAENITFAGSSTVLPIMEGMSPVFKKHGIDIKVQGGGSSAGLKSVRMGLADIGMVSRSLTKKEAKAYQQFALAKDWIVLISHKDNKKSDITKAEVIEAYTQKSSPLHVIAKEAGRATKVVFDNYFDISSKLRSDLVIIGANGQAIASVENDPKALAYVSYSAAHKAIEQGSPIKILTLDGVAGTPENVQSNKYQLARTLNLVYLEKNQRTIDKIQSILSDNDAKVVFASNYVISNSTTKR